MIRSMTGFGTATGSVGDRRVTVEIRSVNHRFFNATVRLPTELSRYEVEVREIMRRRIARGHVTLSARSEDAGTGAVGIDEARFSAYVALIRRLQDTYGLSPSLDVGSILRLPDVFASVSEAESDLPQLGVLVEAAAEALGKARSEEGQRLGTYLLERLAVVEAALERIAARAPERIVAHRDKLRTAVRDLLDGAAPDEQRLALEIAMLAERLDIQEELSRFASHNAAFRATVSAATGDPVGKRLGFLLQEMLREANTTGSKANDAAILTDVVTIKEELERLREQVENLE